MAEFPWHHYSAEESLKKLNVTPAGLSSDEIPERMEKYGRNTLPSAKKLTLFKIILNQFLSPLIYVLLVAALVYISLFFCLRIIK